MDSLSRLYDRSTYATVVDPMIARMVLYRFGINGQTDILLGLVPDSDAANLIKDKKFVYHPTKVPNCLGPRAVVEWLKKMRTTTKIRVSDHWDIVEYLSRISESDCSLINELSLCHQSITQEQLDQVIGLPFAHRLMKALSKSSKPASLRIVFEYALYNYLTYCQVCSMSLFQLALLCPDRELNAREKELIAGDIMSNRYLIAETALKTVEANLGLTKIDSKFTSALICRALSDRDAYLASQGKPMVQILCDHRKFLGSFTREQLIGAYRYCLPFLKSHTRMVLVALILEA
jgi:hypothetical protein